MAQGASNRIAIVREFLDTLGRPDVEGAAAMLDEEAVMTLPFVPQVPDMKGKAAIVEQINATMAQMLEAMHFTFDTLYQTDDPDVVIAEYRSKCPIRGSDGFYENDYIGVFRFRGDRIVLYKEYLNPLKLGLYAEQLGG